MVKFQVSIKTICSILIVCVFFSVSMISQELDSVEKQFSDSFLKSLKRDNRIYDIPVFKIEYFEGLDEEELKGFERSISSLSSKLKLIQENKKEFNEVKWEDFVIEKAFTEDGITMYLGILYLFFPEGKIEPTTFKIVRIDSKMGIFDIKGKVVNDEVQQIPRH